MTKTKIFGIDGKEKGSIELPKFFSEKIREDIVAKVLETKKRRQPYSPSPVAGKQHSAKGKLSHARHVWRSGYGRGSSRVPRKIFSQKGSQFNWEAAEVPFARGGMRAHPPKISSMLEKKRINKKEMETALKSALSATANEKMIRKKYARLKDTEIKSLPFIVESGITELGTKQLIESVKKILGNLSEISERNKKIRSGKGKSRGRRYKKSAGVLIVTGKNEKMKTKIFDVANAGNLGVNDLAKGGLGRLVVFTENEIKNIAEKLK